MKRTTRRRITAFALTAMLSTTTLSGMAMPASAASVVTLASTSTSKPAKPSSVKVSVSYPSKTKATVKVSWKKVSGASGYQIMTGGNSSMSCCPRRIWKNILTFEEENTMNVWKKEFLY